MPTPGATTTTSLTEIIDSEFISRVILEANRAPTVAEQVAWTIDASGVSSNTYTITQWDSTPVPLSEASGKAETVEFAATEQTLSEISISAATVGIRRALSTEAQMTTIVDSVAGLVRQNALEMMDQIDEDWMANFTSLTNVGGASGVALTVALFGADIATFRAQNPQGTRFAFVGHEKQHSDLKANIRANAGAIFGGEYGNQAAELLDVRSRGFLGVYEGIEMYASTNVPTSVGDHAGALMVAGQSGAVALVGWMPMSTKFDEEIRRMQLDIVTAARYGTGITNQDNALQILSVT